MLTVTIEQLPDQPFTVLGMVRGSTVQCKNFGRDFMAGLKNLVGGEMKSYVDMMNQARDIAYERMIEDAERFPADAVVAMRFASSSIAQGAAEVMAYGTAVKFK